MKANKLSTKNSTTRIHSVYSNMQRGLIYPAPFARFCNFWTSLEAPSRSELGEIAREMRNIIHDKFGKSNTTATFAVSFDFYKSWCLHEGKDELSFPKGMEFEYPEENNGRETSNVFSRSNGTFQDSGATLWVYIKSDKEENLAGVYESLFQLIEPFLIAGKESVYQNCDRRETRDSEAGKVLGCRFSENLNNPADPITVANHSLIGFEDIDHMGGSFVLAQRFLINWDQLHNMSETQIEDLIGRTHEDILLPSRDTRTHIRSARFRDEKGDTKFIMRLGLPFGQSDFVNKDLLYKGSNIRDEEGIYFVGLTKDIKFLEGVMNQQIGDTDGFMNDRLFNHVRSDLGGFFYVPSRSDLNLEPMEWEEKDKESWTRYPGVDWSRLSRHFDDKSENGRMYYNHKNFLYEMATMSLEDKEKYHAPSHRILELISDSFTRWQDSWYFPKGQPEMGHLCAYIARDPEFGPKIAGEVMNASIAVRKGWAIRMTCRLYTSKEYGYRGKKGIGKEEQEGADTFRIHPKEVIVGAMPDLTLAQGRHVMDYQRPEEEMSNYFRGLSEASGAGHIVPDFQKLVDVGISGLLDETKEHLENTTNQTKRDFYLSCEIALQGVQDTLLRYGVLAEERAQELEENLPPKSRNAIDISERLESLEGEQEAEIENLRDISTRLQRLAHHKPESMVDAAQLIFTVFTCLQLNAEPVALGRLDQYLNPFYLADLEKGEINPKVAQEVIDAFWIKIDEKVLQNRIFIHDHQPFGNLAMGGASGPYPQGASLGQWIQQVTVGGVVGDDATEETLAYNDITTMCIRAAARLPLNAPCLSLRVSKNTPDEILEEAAKAILSGGAHPILLNDDKIIPGLLQSGDDVGKGGDNSNDFTPVAEKSGGLWNSKVSLASARNYACDGCYEPMFVGQNWFTLGGFSTLNPLECALNQGRLYASAGPVFLLGQNHSYRSKPPTEIESFDELVELYLDHFYKLWAKALNGQLRTFDTLASICPSPLLSTMIDDCLEKGLDLYEGGARYNVYGPCFIALSSTINSLYNIKHMVFGEKTAVTSLPELMECLMCDWGNNMVEPFISSLVGTSRVEARVERFKRLRDVALSYEKYGEGVERPSYLPDYEAGNLMTYSVDELGDYLVQKIAQLTVKVFRDPFAETAEQMVRFAKKYGTEKAPFGGFQIQPGVGTFENFIAFGGSSGASADGRRLGEAIASDLSPSPNSMDKPAHQKTIDLEAALDSFTGEGAAAIWNGAPTDFNISEDFPEDKLVKILRAFADGHGSNILTITCASPETFANAPHQPERYDLLRVRMGGWSEFFTSMFPLSQEQHLRRPIASNS